ncbi:competence type IV pilus minor pilin ComGF [Neobacillus dielmonensis]|uniref:competence type IV pilus minor pilin ComGF n=1 Tax=Neobacillus dielmonensis TaxID=1347369 RepID=UPI000ABEA7F9|nr:competence type IV pilus minor pilin ComGF [Neobacillus dielmonensis]
MIKVIGMKEQRSVAHLNEAAFTLIEVLLALSILSVVICLVTPAFEIMLNKQDTNASLQIMEWEVFCSQFKKEIRMSNKAEVVSNRLILTKATETVIYEKYESNLRRRVNSTGHEIVLQNVSSYTFTLLKNAVKLTAKDDHGKEYTVIAYFFGNGGNGT